MKSILVLLIALMVQIIILLPYLAYRARQDLIYIIKNPQLPLLIGTLSGIGSFLWFAAFALAFIAYVKTIGQIEFILSIFISIYFFKEKLYRAELYGMGLLMIGTILILFA